MPIDAEEVRRIASLARLELDDETVASMRRQLGSVLDYVAMLDEIDLSDVPPTAHGPGEIPPLREDEVTDSLANEEALSSAPEAGEGHFKVPRVIDR